MMNDSVLSIVGVEGGPSGDKVLRFTGWPEG